MQNCRFLDWLKKENSTRHWNQKPGPCRHCVVIRTKNPDHPTLESKSQTKIMDHASIVSDANPVLEPPPGIGRKDFRDLTSAWYVESISSWRVAIGSKNLYHAGIVLVYETKDFLNYNLLPSVLHEVPGTGMWECVDFYPLSTEDGVKHVLKASFDDDTHDYYGVGVYDPDRELWAPDDPGMDVGTRLRLDYGKYYASKSFYNNGKRRRFLWGWTGETDSERTDLLKGWASLQTIPRTRTVWEEIVGFEKLKNVWGW